jgi:ketosteroid isomerase-like protein
VSKAIFEALFAKYTQAVTATDVEAIVSIYAEEAKIQIPVGGPVHAGISTGTMSWRNLSKLQVRRASPGGKQRFH